MTAGRSFWLPAALAVLAAGVAQAQALTSALPPMLMTEIGHAGPVVTIGPSTNEQPPEGSNLVGTSGSKFDHFATQGDAIEAQYCLQFGFEFRAPNLPPPLALAVTVQLDHPLWTRPDGRQGTREVYPNTLSSQWSYSGYSLDESWTLVPGTWRFSVMLGDVVLATQSFELHVRPGQVMDGETCAPPST